MYLTAAHSLLPFWALLWPKKPLSEDALRYLCSLMITEVENNFCFISIPCAINLHVKKNLLGLHSTRSQLLKGIYINSANIWQQDSVYFFDAHSLQLQKVLLAQLEGKGVIPLCTFVFFFWSICMLVFAWVIIKTRGSQSAIGMGGRLDAALVGIPHSLQVLRNADFPSDSVQDYFLPDTFPLATAPYEEKRNLIPS